MAQAMIVTVRLTPEQYEWLKREAELLDETLSWVLRDLIDQERGAGAQGEHVG